LAGYNPQEFLQPEFISFTKTFHHTYDNEAETCSEYTLIH